MNAKKLVSHIRKCKADYDFFDTDHLPAIADFIERYSEEFNAFISDPVASPGIAARKAEKNVMEEIAKFVRSKVSKKCTVTISGDNIAVSYNENFSPGNWFEDKLEAYMKINPHFRQFPLNENIPGVGIVQTVIYDLPEMQPF